MSCRVIENEMYRGVLGKLLLSLTLQFIQYFTKIIIHRLNVMAEKKKLAGGTVIPVVAAGIPSLTVAQRVRNLSSLIADFRILLRILGTAHNTQFRTCAHK